MSSLSTAAPFDSAACHRDQRSAVSRAPSAWLAFVPAPADGPDRPAQMRFRAAPSTRMGNAVENFAKSGSAGDAVKVRRMLSSELCGGDTESPVLTNSPWFRRCFSAARRFGLCHCGSKIGEWPRHDAVSGVPCQYPDLFVIGGGAVKPSAKYRSPAGAGPARPPCFPEGGSPRWLPASPRLRCHRRMLSACHSSVPPTRLQMETDTSQSRRCRPRVRLVRRW